MTDSGSDDIAVILYREDAWDVDLLPTALTEDLAGLIHVLRQQLSIGGTIGLAAVGDDFVAIKGGRRVGRSVRVRSHRGRGLAARPAQVLDYLDLVVLEDEDLDQVLPAGDLSIFADLSLDQTDLGVVVEDLDLLPDEALQIIARKLCRSHFRTPRSRPTGS